MRTSVFLATVALGGCGDMALSDYREARASAECKRSSVCALGFFESEYVDLEDCVDEVSDSLKALEDSIFDSCDYDGMEASRCVSRIRSLSCEDYVEGEASLACDQVWDCINV